MNRRKLQFNALRAFEAAARHSSVSGAARELGVTHSAVSHQVKRLEDQLGVSLFERTNRGLRISAEGSRLLPVLIESFDRIGAALDDLGSGEEQQTIRVTCTPTFASRWLVSKLPGWYAKRDASRIQLLPSLEIFDFEAENIDLAIRCGIPPWPGLRHRLLMPIHLVPVCSPGYLQRRGKPESPAAAIEYDLIHADIGDHGQGQEWRDWLEGCGVQAPRNLSGLSVHDPSLAMQAAADGLGLAIGYRELIDADLRDGKLICAFEQSVRHAYAYYLVCASGFESRAELSQLHQWLIEQV